MAGGQEEDPVALAAQAPGHRYPQSEEHFRCDRNTESAREEAMDVGGGVQGTGVVDQRTE